MKVLTLGLIALSVAYGQEEADDLRLKRQTYSLPRGSELLLEPLRTTFQCRHDGYFADIDNNCRVYHICTRSIETRQLQRFSFLCGNLTMFNQLTLTCTRPEDSVPCRNAPAFFYVNDNIGIEDQPFLYDDDVSNADQFIQTNKINTPGNVHVPTKRREGASLPRGSELLLEPLRTTFQCRHDGYFADIDNNCRVYHICTRSIETRQLQRFSFLCGNLTMFNQLTLTCTRPEDSVPCRNAPAFFYVNDNIGIEDQPFLYDDDVSNADQFIQTNKINTPGNVHVPTKRREGARSL
ncbi:uncharacterized protein ISCGN_000138 [Ixodes scapularis]